MHAKAADGRAAACTCRDSLLAPGAASPDPCLPASPCLPCPAAGGDLRQSQGGHVPGHLPPGVHVRVRRAHGRPADAAHPHFCFLDSVAAAATASVSLSFFGTHMAARTRPARFSNVITCSLTDQTCNLCMRDAAAGLRASGSAEAGCVHGDSGRWRGGPCRPNWSAACCPSLCLQATSSRLEASQGSERSAGLRRALPGRASKLRLAPWCVPGCLQAADVEGSEGAAAQRPNWRRRWPRFRCPAAAAGEPPAPAIPLSFAVQHHIAHTAIPQQALHQHEAQGERRGAHVAAHLQVN